MMNADILEGKWRKTRGVIKERWGDITDDRLTRVEGRYDRLLGRLQERYGYGRRRMERNVGARLRDLSDYGEQLQETGEKVVSDVDAAVTRHRWVLLAAALFFGLAIGFWLQAQGRRQADFRPFP
jgi:uncharacterized protein YjbJ (UPF0337 family)